MNNDSNPQEEILNFSLNILIKTIASKKIDLDDLRYECNSAIFQEHETKLSSDAKREAMRILERKILYYKNNKQLNNSAHQTGSHHEFDNFEISENEGTALHIITDDPNGNLTLTNFKISKNKGNAFVYNGGTKPKTNVELILDAVKEKLPDEIKLDDLAPLIKDVLDSKSPEEAKRKIDLSSVGQKFKDPALWVSIGNLILNISKTMIGQ